MDKDQLNNPVTFLHKGQGKGNDLVLQHIIKGVETGAGLNFPELKDKYSQERLFALALAHVTTTKKALCTALGIPIEAGCKYKRKFEKSGTLKQSIDEVICPVTKHPAHLISTNPDVFELLLKSKNTQTKLF